MVLTPLLCFCHTAEAATEENTVLPSYLKQLSSEVLPVPQILKQVIQAHILVCSFLRTYSALWSYAHAIVFKLNGGSVHVL